MSAYYSEHDPFAAEWLRNLIDAGEIAPGVVDERDIQQVTEGDLEGFTQVHLFAGIGGWSRALRIAGWSDDDAVWTGSCPCQPFSANGRNKGTQDHRDLWPVFARLISNHRPPVVFGEQSERAITFGWLDRLCDDLEASDYAIGSSVLPACSVGSRHERSRLWWVAHSQYRGVEVGRGTSVAVEDCAGRERISCPVTPGLSFQARALVGADGQGGATGTQARTPEPDFISLVDGIPGSVGRTRAYGNAIVPQVAAEFILAADRGGAGE